MPHRSRRLMMLYTALPAVPFDSSQRMSLAGRRPVASLNVAVGEKRGNLAAAAWNLGLDPEPAKSGCRQLGQVFYEP